MTPAQRGVSGPRVRQTVSERRAGAGAPRRLGSAPHRARRRPPARGVAVRWRRPGSRVPRGAGARAEQGFQFLARTSAVPKLHGELARCPGTAAAAGPRAGAGAATRTGIAPAPAPARGPRCRPCPAAAPRPSAGRPRSARAWRRQSRRIPGTRWWTPRAWRRRPTTACAARSAISTGRSSTRSNVRRGAGGGRCGTQARAARLVNGARAHPAPPGRASIGSPGGPAPSRGASRATLAGARGPPGGRTAPPEPRRPGRGGGGARVPGVVSGSRWVPRGVARPARAAPPGSCQKWLVPGPHPGPTHSETRGGASHLSGGPPSRGPCGLQSLGTTVRSAPRRLQKQWSPLGEG